MNRRMRRLYLKEYKKNKNKNDVDFIDDGDKVKLDYEKIIKDKKYNKKTDKYKEFVEKNKNKIFTVFFEEKYLGNKLLACLQEDDNEPKWLFWVGFLKKV